MLHPSTALRWTNPIVGWGVFATAPIPRGTITWVQDALDQVFDSTRVASLSSTVLEPLDKYSYVNGRGERILCWDHARYINHSCIPNVLSPGFEFDVALRNIAAGEEIVTDYGALNLDAPFPCACGTATCRGVVQPDDFERLAPHWDRRVRRAFRRIGHVPQALWALLPDPAAVERVLARIDPTPSISAHRCALPPAAIALPVVPLPPARAPFAHDGGAAAAPPAPAAAPARRRRASRRRLH